MTRVTIATVARDVKIEQYSQIIELDIEIWENCTILGEYYVAMPVIRLRVTMATVAR